MVVVMVAVMVVMMMWLVMAMVVVGEIPIIMLLYITRVPVVTDQTAVASQEPGPVGLQVRPPPSTVYSLTFLAER